MALKRPAGPTRHRWFDDYVTQTMERDVLELAKIRQRDKLPQLLERLAGQTGQVLNVSAAADSIAVERRTADTYTKVLEAVFLIHRLPAWGTNLSARAASLPKVHVVDSGVAARLLRLSAARLGSLDPTALTEFGHLLETALAQASGFAGVADLLADVEREAGYVVGLIEHGSLLGGHGVQAAVLQFVDRCAGHLSSSSTVCSSVMHLFMARRARWTS
ncbi:MAG: DUF4143 domain-containing protein [Acidimicrobiales bacterium]